MVVLYDPNNYFGVLFRLHGSVWPAVFPFCVFLSAEGYLLYYLRHNGTDVTCKNYGHSIISLLLSFLVVGRANLTYQRYWQARSHVALMTNAARMIACDVIAFSGRDNKPRARKWRKAICRRLIRLTKTTAKIISNVPQNLHLTTGKEMSASDLDSPDAMYVSPFEIACSLQAIILAHDEYLVKPMDAKSEVVGIISTVTQYMDCFYDTLKFTNTPVPLPLIQMARTLLFFWLVTLPFALVKSMDRPVFILVEMFFITYGYLGLEHVSMELHDPFGSDVNDLETEKLFHHLDKCIYNEFENDHAGIFHLSGDILSSVSTKSHISEEY